MRPELLSPAGNFEKLKAAVLYGADAVYLAGKRFGMRSAADNFTDEELFTAAEYVHSHGKKIYLTLNTMPHGYEYPALREFLTSIKDAGIDALIVADFGVMALVKELLPDVDIHISTQASIVSPEAANAYASLGATRLVLARELTLDEIKAIRDSLPDSVELEAFVHGSMCVSYSGRCMLSHNLTGRDANRGACTQPCRWVYTVTEEKRPEMPYPVEQNELGTFIMSSKDMCTIEIIPNAYRMAIDKYLKAPDLYTYDPRLMRELESVSHREYCTGFYLDDPMENPQLSTINGYIREKAYFATALSKDELPLPDSLADRCDLFPFIQRNKVSIGDKAELISPNKFGRAFEVTELFSEKGEPLESAPHPAQRFFVKVPFEVNEGDIMRSGSDDI